MESTFARIKHFLVIATRYDKSEQNYANMLVSGFIMVGLPSWVN
ncbi:transposase (fragment) [Xenorhabdus szentirmaii DSM 16338]|uniref:Transposase n=1 Tax=Xenorhabdus szentirmaii DSM 16338 TaxID=1427518 RepID=W1IYY6_9GAMM